MFKHNHTIDIQRKTLAQRYDEVFARLCASPVGSCARRGWQRKEMVIRRQTANFLQANHRYFSELRKFYLTRGNLQLISINEK